MGVLSLALALSSAISACQSAGNANLLDSITEEMINEAILETEKYDYSEYDLSFMGSKSLIEQKIYRYAEINNLFIEDRLSALKEVIKNQDYYVAFDDIDNVYLNTSDNNDGNEEGGNDDIFIFPGGHHEIPGPGINFPMTPASYDDNFHFDNNIPGHGGGGGTGGDSEKLEIKTLNEANIAVNTFGNFQGRQFFGIWCSKEACMTVYNAIANWANNRITDPNTEESYTLSSAIFKLVKGVGELTSVGASISVMITRAYNALINYFSSMVNLLVTTITSAPFYLKIIASIVILIGVAIAFIIVAMIVFGLLEKGFYIGFFLTSIFSWEPGMGLLE